MLLFTLYLRDHIKKYQDSHYHISMPFVRLSVFDEVHENPGN